MVYEEGVWLMRLLKYLFQYRFRHMGELMRNAKKDALECNEDFKGKRVLLSGATAGIGLETAHLFAKNGAELVLLNRNPQKAERLKKELEDSYGSKVTSLIVDFNELAQVQSCADTLLEMKEPLDIIIHNSGVFNTTKQFSKDDIEMVFQVNHLGAFLLNYRLKERLKKENRARIIFVNSEGHRFALAGVHTKDLRWRWHWYSGFKSYGASKTAQLLTMYRFQEYFAGSKVTINAMHPGNVRSAMGENNGRLYNYLKKKLILSSALDPDISAKALHYLALSPNLEGVSGKFFHLTEEELPAPHARDMSAVDAVWEKSLELCGLNEV
jgi:retinol dehydrogenase-13